MMRCKQNRGRCSTIDVSALVRFQLCCALLVGSTVGCSSPSPTTSGSNRSREKPIVYAVNYPLAYFAGRIGGESINVVLPVPNGLDPADWTPTPEVITGFQAADLILLNGADYAAWTKQATLPINRIAVATRAVQDQFIEVPDAITHSHGPGDQHSHAGLVAETWLDPGLAIAQAQVIRDELKKLRPDSAMELQANFDSLRTDLEDLDADFESTFAAAPRSWTASHRVYEYLARRYSLDIDSLQWEPSEYPTDQQWSEFEALLRKRPSGLMLWEEQPLEKTVSRLADLGVEAVTFRPLAAKPASGDYLSGMRENLANLIEVTAD